MRSYEEHSRRLPESEFAFEFTTKCTIQQCPHFQMFTICYLLCCDYLQKEFFSHLFYLEWNPTNVLVIQLFARSLKDQGGTKPWLHDTWMLTDKTWGKLMFCVPVHTPHASSFHPDYCLPSVPSNLAILQGSFCHLQPALKRLS